MSKQKIYSDIETLWNTFSTAHASTKKKDGAVARKALSELKKLVTPYKKASVEEAKAAKVSS